MTALVWDKVGERVYETGVDHGVLYIPDNTGEYADGYAWNGLTAVTESPSGAEANKQYADNQVYVNLLSAEEFGGTIEAFTYPVEFEQCDGTASPQPGVNIGQQGRKTFGFSYRTRLGNDLQGTDYGYKLHLVYGATASPSEKANATINDSPEAINFSWDFTTVPVAVGGHKPSAQITINSTLVDATVLAELEALLYGTSGTDPSMPLPDYVITMFAGTITQVSPTVPTYNSTTDMITIPTVTGVIYMINGEIVSGTVHITADTVVTAKPAAGYKFPAVSVDRWLVVYS